MCGIIGTYLLKRKLNNVCKSFTKYLKAPNRKNINVYKYTDFIQKLDDGLFDIYNYKHLVKCVTLIYYYQLILICKLQEPNRKIKNFLDFPGIIKHFIHINNNDIDYLKLGIFEYKYDSHTYNFLDNYDTIIKIIQNNIINDNDDSNSKDLNIYVFKSQDNIYSDAPKRHSILFSSIYEPVKERIYESIEEAIYTNLFYK